MKKKIWLIPVVCIALIAVLWFSGLIPKQIARIAGTNYVKEHFPEMELECVDVDWADVFGDYLIAFKDKDGNEYSCVIGPSLFPTSLGQGLFAISDYYNEHYSVSNVGGVDGPDNVTIDSLKNPPALTVSCGNMSVNAWLGTYTWFYKNLDDGTAQAINADSSHPLSMLDSIPTLSIVPSTLSSVEPRLAVLQFSNAPDKIEVKCYKVDEKDTDKGEEITVKDMSFQMKEGRYLYEIFAKWEDTKESSGTAYYAFQTIESDMKIIDTNDVSNTDTNLTSAISSVLNEKYNNTGKPDGLVHIETYNLLASSTASGTPLKGNSEHMTKATFYLLVYHMKYSVNGGQLEEVEGDFVPTTMDFAIDENGEYTLEDYWTPQTSANYEKEVRSKFPGEAADNALNTEKYAEDLIKESWRLATQYLNQTKSSSN